MKVLLLGAGGQLGWELTRSLPDRVQLQALGRDQGDVLNPTQLSALMEEFEPGVVINAAAYTAVDQAESDRETAFAVNRDGAQNVALAAARCDARLIHVSTDFVFSDRQATPYVPDDPPAPRSVYGESKLAGEEAVLAAHPEAVIVRTSWLYSAHGGNFVKTMLRLMGEREQLGIIADQVGSPTWAHNLARAIWTLAPQDCSGIYHFSDEGVASWYDFAVAIAEEAQALGLLGNPARIEPIMTADYPTPAQRPSYSVLDKQTSWRQLGWKSDHWRVALRHMLRQLSESH